MLVSDLGYILYKKKYRDTSLLVTLFTQRYGKITGIVKGFYRNGQKKFSSLELGYQLSLQLKPPKNPSGLYIICQSELSQDNLFIYQNNYLKQMCCYYISELIYYLYPDAICDDGLFHAYQNTLKGLMEGKQTEACLRAFEVCLLTALGYEVTFEMDDNNQPIKPESYYQVILMSQPRLIHASEGCAYKLIFLGEILQALSNRDWCNLEDSAKEVLQAMKLIHKLYINHLLQGRLLESRRLLREYKALSV